MNHHTLSDSSSNAEEHLFVPETRLGLVIGGSSGMGGPSPSMFGRAPFAYATHLRYEPPAIDDSQTSSDAGSSERLSVVAATPATNDVRLSAIQANPLADADADLHAHAHAMPQRMSDQPSSSASAQSAAVADADHAEALLTPPFAFDRRISSTPPPQSLILDPGSPLHAAASPTTQFDHPIPSASNAPNLSHSIHFNTNPGLSHSAMDASAPAYLPPTIEDPDDGISSDSEADVPASIQFETRADMETAPSDRSDMRSPLLETRLATNANINIGRSRIASVGIGREDFMARRQNNMARTAPLAAHGVESGAALAGIRRQTSSGSIRSWHDVTHLDAFLARLYQYYLGKGFKCIVLSAATNTAALGFVIVLSTFLFSCVNYDLIHSKRRLSDIVDPNCFSNMHTFTFIIVVAFTAWWLLMVVRLVADVPRLLEIRRFYQNVLEVSDFDLQSALWRDIVSRIIQSRSQQSQSNPTAVLRRLDAHSIANRILRKENYMIALFNKDILNLSVPWLGSRPFMTRLMEWNLSYCIFSFVFDDRGVFRKRFLRESNRIKLAESLQQRFRTMAILNLILSPFLLIFLVVYSLFKYAEEYRRNPSGISSRQYSPFASWKFREFNELPHLLRARLNRSTENADMYIRQFRNEPLIIVAKFVSFMSGSLGAILLALTLFEEELQQGFEITPGRSALFYIGVFGSVLAISRAFIPPETEVHEPERWMREIALDTHYLPDEWRSQAHTPHVRSQFERLYDYKLVLLAQELISVVFAPLILYYSLPPCSSAIVDFFREFTVHVDGLGYVCSFAVFDFRRHGNVRFGVQTDDGGGAGGPSRNDLVSQGGKMEHSFVHFKANYPDWDPGVEGSEYIGRLLARRRERSMLHQSRLGAGMQHATNNASMHTTSSPYRRTDSKGSSMLLPPTNANQAATTNNSYIHPLHNGLYTPHFDDDSNDIVASYLRGDSSVINTTHQLTIHPQNIGRELFDMLDAVYEANLNPM